MLVEKYIPETGIGGFDLDISEKVVTVVMRVQLVFSVDVIEKGKSDYRENFTKAVKESWENKCVIVNKATGRVLTPKFEIEFTDRDPHYIAMVDRQLQSQPSVSILKARLTGKQLTEIPNTFGLPRYAYLPAPIVQKPNLKGELKDGYPRDIIQSWYKGLKYFVMATKGSLDHCARSIDKEFGHNKGFGVKVNSETQWCGKEYSEIVSRIREETLVSERPTSSRPLYGIVTVKLRDESASDRSKKGAVKNVSPRKYTEIVEQAQPPILINRATICHEFGHMLGIPDEYYKLHDNMLIELGFDGSINNVVNIDGLSKLNDVEASMLHDLSGSMHMQIQSQLRYIKLCIQKVGGLPVMGVATMSMMSYGGCVRPEHFVTICEALDKATKIIKIQGHYPKETQGP